MKLDTELKMMNAIDSLDNRLLNIRAGRANPNILNGIMVEYYGTPTPLNGVANVSVPEAKKLFIKPFDKSVIKNIEKAINEANIGLTPMNNGEVVILTIPDLTEDRRKEYVKLAKKEGEETKIQLRNIRQDDNNDIKKSELSEDEQKKLMDNVQELINKYNKIVDEKIKEKENELMSI